MNKIQKLNFGNIDAFLDYLPENELAIVEELRNLIFECIPHVKEKLSYNVPFYSLNKRICYIWPSVVPWGNVPDGAVSLGFNYGSQITDPFNVLESKDRKNVSTVTYYTLEELNPDQVRFFLYETIEILSSKK